MEYSATFNATDETTPEQHDFLTYGLNEWSGELQEIIDICTANHCEAVLYDDAGFKKGWVHSDGSYTLN